MKSGHEKKPADGFQDDNSLRRKIQETMQDLALKNPGERRAAEEWLYQKFLFGLAKPGGAALRTDAAGRRKTVKPHDAKPMPRQARIALLYHGEFSLRELEKMSYGFLPASPEDRWFVCLDEAHLCFYRSGTRVCIFELEFEKSPRGVRVKDAWVDLGFIEQNDWNSPAYAERLLDYLIRRLLLGQAVPFPFPASAKKSLDRSMLRLGLMGKKVDPEEA
jgi:hypothetical protein